MIDIKEYKELKEELLISSVGVSEALERLLQAVIEAKTFLHKENYTQVSRIAYQEICEYFVFLQRTVGDIDSLNLKLESVIQKYAFKHNLVYEEAEKLFKQKFLDINQKTVDNKTIQTKEPESMKKFSITAREVYQVTHTVYAESEWEARKLFFEGKTKDVNMEYVGPGNDEVEVTLDE